jgi:hypothetical protein
MNIIFWSIVIILCVIVYFILSFTFRVIGDVSIKIYKKFKNNIGKGEMKNEE